MSPQNPLQMFDPLIGSTIKFCHKATKIKHTWVALHAEWQLLSLKNLSEIQTPVC
jgi:hypothetical protein